jgi:hypothetical protein
VSADGHIRLQFVLGHALASAAIAWFSAGHFSHVDAVMPSGALLGSRSDGPGGTPKGVYARPAAYEPWKLVVQINVPCTKTQEKKFYAFLRAQVGKPYDHTAIFAFAVNRNWRDDDSWFCSELITAAMEKAKIVPELYLAANKVTPVACALVASAVGGVVVYDSRNSGQ